MKGTIYFFTLLFWATSTSLSAQETTEIWVSDARGGNSASYAIYRFDADGSNGRVFTQEHLDWPQDILFLEDRAEVLVSSLRNGRITKYDPDTGEFLGDFATGLSGPTRMEMRKDTLYVLQWLGSGAIERFLPDGTRLTPFSTRGVPLGIGMAWDSIGRMYVSAYGRPAFNGNPAIPARVHRYDHLGNYLGVFVSESELNGPTNLWFDPAGSGDLFVVDYNAGNVKRFSASGAAEGVYVTGLQQPEGVARLENGDYLIGDGGSGNVKRYSAAGTFIENRITGSGIGLRTPNAVRLRVTEETNDVTDNAPWAEEVRVYPTVGRRFRLEAEDLKLDVRIFDAEGRLIDSLLLDQRATWNAQNLPAGPYWMTLIRTDGRRMTQKILVADRE